MKTQAIFITSLLLCFFYKSLSQPETYKWYFGKYAALDFSTSPPTVLANSAMNTVEGCASIADANGNLLFYTDATKIWDQSHSFMANGSGLLGNGLLFTSQSSIIIKQPGSNSLYYVFTLADEGGSDGLRYSIVDMTLAAGMGSVTIKNSLLQTPSSEKIAAVNHCNGTDVWLVTHDTSDNFRSFLITGSGISSNPVISTFPASNMHYIVGCMKISPNGKKLMLTATSASINTGAFETYDFDNSSGIVSNRQTLLSDNSAYGCEFSPDGTKLYGNDLNHVLQWDLCAGSYSAIIASQSTVSTASFTGGNLQLAPDGKIYVTKVNDTKLAVINQPNLPGIACNYVDQGLYLSTGTLVCGLPNFNSSFFFKKLPQSFSYTYTPSGTCLSTTFNPLSCPFSAPDILSVQWVFGDPVSAAQNTSTVLNASHKFSMPGTYTVQLIRNFACYSDTISQPITIADLSPILQVSGKTTVCNGESVTLSATGADTYSWTNISTSQSIAVTATSSSIYTVSGTSTLSGCSSVNTVSITVLKCTGIKEDNMVHFKVFPNPFSGELQVENYVFGQLEIYNTFGELVYKNHTYPGLQTFNLTALSNGVYLLKFCNNKNNVEYCRIIKTGQK